MSLSWMLTAAFRPAVCVCVLVCGCSDFCCGVVMAYLSFCLFGSTELLDSSWKSKKSCPHSCCDSVVRLKDTQFDVWSFKIVYTIAVEVGIFFFLFLKENHSVNFVNQINQPKVRFCPSTYDGISTTWPTLSTRFWRLRSPIFRWTQTRCSGIHNYVTSEEFSFESCRLAQ